MRLIYACLSNDPIFDLWRLNQSVCLLGEIRVQRAGNDHFAKPRNSVAIAVTLQFYLEKMLRVLIVPNWRGKKTHGFTRIKTTNQSNF